MIYKKIIGFALLFVGLSIIGCGLWSSYGIFTGQEPAPEIFSPISEEGSVDALAGGVEQQIQQVIGEQLKNMLPSDFLPKILNLTAWSIFMGILVFAGGKISSIGVSLLK